jgi:hypothetical protein
MSRKSVCQFFCPDVFPPNSNHRQPQDSNCVFYFDRLVNLGNFSAIQAKAAGADDPGTTCGGL